MQIYCLSLILEPISSAKVKKAFNTKDVHLLVGDEVDIISKSDDGNFFEFEVYKFAYIL